MPIIFNKILILFSIFCVCIGIAIVICFIIHTKIEDKKIEKTRRFCIQLEKLNAENKSPYMKEMMTDEIIREIRRIHSELDSVFDKLENMKIK